MTRLKDIKVAARSLSILPKGILLSSLLLSSGLFANESVLEEQIEVKAPILLAQSTTAPKRCRPRRGRFYFQFEEAKIFDVLKQISLITCKNFIVSEGVKGGKKELTIISRSPVRWQEAYSAFLSALEANNMALVRVGRFNKVVERKQAKSQALPMFEKDENGEIKLVKTGTAISYHDAQVTFIHELKHISKDQVQPILKSMKSKNGDMQFVGDSLLILTDSAANIRRMIHIIDRIDASGAGNQINIVTIQYAEAADIAQKLTDIFGNSTVRSSKKSGKKKGSSASAEGDGLESVSIDKIVADERTNRLIIIASEKAFKHIQETIEVLDVPGDTNSSGSRVYVHPLNNADATKIASTLSSLAQGSSVKNKRHKKKKGGADSASLFEGEVKITADEATNSLVIIASARDYRSLKTVIGDLDIRRPQVFIEAAIMEVSLNDDRRMSIDAYMAVPTTIPGLDGAGLSIIGNEGGAKLITSGLKLAAAQSAIESATGSSFNAQAAVTAASTASESLQNMLGWLSVQGPSVESSFGPVPSFGMVLNALQNNANVNVLSTPHIMTVDNEKAELSVGKKVPVLSGISNFGGGLGGGLGGGFGPNVKYEDVKLKFTVTPHVNERNDIRLEVEQEISDLGESIPVGQGVKQPVITQRQLKTTIVAEDQQTMVLGGLIQTRKTESESKFPILGDIPIIGWLFKTWSSNESKNNLIIVLTPYVIRDREDLKKVYERKMKERQEFIEAYYGTAQEYNPYINYERKTGPLGMLLAELKTELTKIENGGAGDGDFLITPELSLEENTENEVLTIGKSKEAEKAAISEVKADKQEAPTAESTKVKTEAAKTGGQ